MELRRSVRLSSRCHLSSFFLQPLWLLFLTRPRKASSLCQSDSGTTVSFSSLSFRSQDPQATWPSLSLCALPCHNIYSSLPPLCDSLEDSQQRQNYRTVKKHNNIYASVCGPSCDQVRHLGGGAVAEIVVGDKAVANDDWSPQLLRCILTNKQTSQNFCLCLNTSGR